MWTDMSRYFWPSFGRWWALAPHHVTFLKRLSWHFPDGSMKLLETTKKKGSLNGSNPLQQVWCAFIDRLIPWRSRICRGKRLMKQMDTCIPYRHNRTRLPAVHHSPDPTGSLYLLLRIACHYGTRLKGHLHKNILMMFAMRFLFFFSLPKPGVKEETKAACLVDAQHVELAWQ